MKPHSLVVSGFFLSLRFVAVLVVLCSETALGFGSMGPIAASLGGEGLFCAIDAGGKQEVLCWGRNATAVSPPPTGMVALSGGDGFLCGILSNTSQAFCWSSTGAPANLVPAEFRTTAYSSIAAGASHVCAVRGPYFSDHDSGTVDCWEISKTLNQTLTSSLTSRFTDQSIANTAFRSIAAGDGFTCGDPRDDAGGGLICWGPQSNTIQITSNSSNSNSHAIIASSRASLCAVSVATREVSCWGETGWPVAPPGQTRFVGLSAGSTHFCGIREDNHGVECWGFFNSSSVPKGSGFKALASSEFATCGIREDDLVLDCWANSNVSSSVYDPPLELCIPGICSSRDCGSGEFAFNASVLSEPDLTNLCVRKELKICSPCGTGCAAGSFLSSPCSAHSDRVCTACSLCQTPSCRAECGQPPARPLWPRLRHVTILAGGAVAGLVLVVALGFIVTRPGSGTGPGSDPGQGKKFKYCVGKAEIENEAGSEYSNSAQSAAAPCPGVAQVFRLSELKDATNGFKEFNELGRGSYGFVYRAALPDGRQVAVKRANAATIISTNSRDFEIELEILCKIRHCNIVNLLGYCSEMGERLLVYEYMPHGTLHDHLHGGLSPVNWSLRFRIAMQAAKGLEYLHKEFSPPVVHRDVKTSNILIDSDWSARIADFGLILSADRDLSGDLSTDVYSFGVVLLEILSGRKAFDRNFDPPSLFEWARPLIKQGKAAAVIDRSITLPRNVEPLLKLVEIAEMATRENPTDRPGISEIANSLEQIVKDGLIL